MVFWYYTHTHTHTLDQTKTSIKKKTSIRQKLEFYKTLKPIQRGNVSIGMKGSELGITVISS